MQKTDSKTKNSSYKGLAKIHRNYLFKTMLNRYYMITKAQKN